MMEQLYEMAVLAKSGADGSLPGSLIDLP